MKAVSRSNRGAGAHGWPALLGLATLLICILTSAQPALTQSIRDDLYVANGPVGAVVTAGTTIYIGGFFTRVGPATGCAIPFDATTGQPLAIPKVAGIVSAVAPDGSGGWYIGGSFTHVGGVPRSNIAHFLADHTLSSWSPGADDGVTTLAVSGSVVYVGGIFTSIGGQPRNGIAALDAVSGLATSWDPNATATGVPYVRALTVDGSKVYVGGFFTGIGGQPRNSIAALDAGTGLATAWDPNAVGPGIAVVYALAVSGSTVYAGGFFTSIGGQARNFIAALDAGSGLALPAWNPNSNQTVTALAVDASKVYVGGGFTTIGGQARNNIAALDPSTGLADPNWIPNANASVNAITLDGSRVYAGGSFTTIGGQPLAYVAVLDAATGLADPTWSPNVNSSVLSISVSGSTVHLGGSFSSVGGQVRNRLAAIDAVTGVPTAWDPNANGAVRALALSGSTMYIGGSFTTVGGQTRNRIAAVDAATGAPTAWNPNSSIFFGSGVYALAVGASTVYAGGTFTSIGGLGRNNIAALDASSGLADPAWNPNADDRVRALAVTGSKVYAAGLFTNIGGQPRNRIAALDASTGLADPAWNPNADNTVSMVVVDGSRVYAGGFFTNIGGQPRNRIAALDIGTGLADQSWDPNADGTVWDILANATTVYAGGAFTNIGGQPRRGLAALDATTGLASPWDPSVSDSVVALALSGATVYAGGFYNSIGGFPQTNIAAISQGVLDVPAPEPMTGISLARLAPNPALGPVEIEYTLDREAPVRLGVFDLQGREVARLVDAVRSAGRHHAVWDRRGLRGAAPSGLYFVRYTVAGRSVSKRVVLIQ